MYYRSGFSCHLIDMSEVNTVRYDIMSGPGDYIGYVKFNPNCDEWAIHLVQNAQVTFGFIAQIQTCLLSKLAHS